MGMKQGWRCNSKGDQETSLVKWQAESRAVGNGKKSLVLGKGKRTKPRVAT